MSEQPWFRHLWSVGRPLIPPHTHSTQSSIPDPSVWPSDILFRSAQPHLHPFHRALHFHVFWPKILLIPPARGRSKIPTKIPSGPPSQYPVKISNQPSLQMSQPGSIKNFQPNILPHHPARVCSNFPQENSMSQPHLTPNYPPRKITPQYPSCMPFTK